MSLKFHINMKGECLKLYYIYKIENLLNNKKYIGLTNNIARRRARHFTDLRCNRHDNSFLQKEFIRDGEQNFSFEVIFSGDVSVEEIGEKEKFYIKHFDSYLNGYNQNEGGNFGPSNGGSHLTKSDLFNIMAALEFMSRPGQVLANMYDVTRTTISRIKKGENHCEIRKEYDSLALEEREAIYKIFCESSNFYETKVNSTIIQTKRKLSEEQVHLIFLNEELKRPVSITSLISKLNINSSNTIYTILKGESYKDFALTYQKLTEEQKNKLAQLLRN